MLKLHIAITNLQVTSVFLKITFSGVYINFKGFLPVAYKFDLVYTLIYRCFSICSSYKTFHEEIMLLTDFFKKNEYAQLFIDKCIKNYLNKLSVPKRVIQVMLVLPFFRFFIF